MTTHAAIIILYCAPWKKHRVNRHKVSRNTADIEVVDSQISGELMFGEQEVSHVKS